MAATTSASRRQLIAALVTVAGTGLVRGIGNWVPEARRTVNPGRVLVVGAGMAGLAAAEQLAQAGHDVLVLEAQSRPGGRVLTLRDPFESPLHVEMGAARIPDNHALTLRAIDRFGLGVAPFYPQYGDEIYEMRGCVARRPCGVGPDASAFPLNLTAEEATLGPTKVLEQLLEPAILALRNLTADDWPPPSLREWDRTLAEICRAHGVSLDVVALRALGEIDAERSPASFLYLLRHLGLLMTERVRYKIVGGMDQLPRSLARRLGNRVKLGARVERIQHGPSSVRVEVNHGDFVQTLVADRLVLTPPVGALRQIPIEPALSAFKQEVFDSLSAEPVARAGVQVRRRRWCDEGLSGFARTDGPMELWHTTADDGGEKGMLAVYIKGEGARSLAALAPQQRKRDVIARIERLLPGVRQDVETVVVKLWDEDPFARGAYARFTPGQLYELGPYLSRAEGCISFAGDYASPWPGWIQGALFSGCRAAREVDDALSASPKRVLGPAWSRADADENWRGI